MRISRKMVELRKRPAPPPAPPPAKKKAAPKGKKAVPAAEEPVAEEPVAEEPAATEGAAAEGAATDAIEATTAKTSTAPASPPKQGEKIELEGFGGEIETNDGQKTTLAQLVKSSKKGVVLFTYPKASTP